MTETKPFNVFSLLVRQWFIFLLLAMLVFGLTYPSLGVYFNKSVGTKPFTFMLLLIAGMGMKSGEIFKGFRSFRPIVLTLACTYVLLPVLLVWSAAYIGMNTALGIGLLVLASTPTTLGSGTIYTRLAGGNAELALALTIISNAASSIMAPLVMFVVFEKDTLNISFGDLFIAVLINVIFPLVLGQIILLMSGNFIKSIGDKLDVLSRIFLAGVILMGASRAADQAKDLSLYMTLLLIFLCGFTHCLTIAVCDFGGRLLRLKSSDRIACMLVGGQKSLPVALSLLMALPFNPDFVALAVLPLVVFHALSLILDSVLVELFRRDLFVLMNSIQSKIASSVSACVLVAIGLLVAFNVSSARKTGVAITTISMSSAESQGREKLNSDADGLAAAIKIELDEPLTTARTLANVLSGIMNKKIKLDMGREQIVTLLRGALENNPRIRGIYTCWEPNALDGLDDAYASAPGRIIPGHDSTGRFVPGWWRDAKGKSVLTLAPVGGYDDQTENSNGQKRNDFYAVPKTKIQEKILNQETGKEEEKITFKEAVFNPSAPKVSCTLQEPVITFTVPIAADGTVYGIVGADIPLSNIQQIIDRAGASLEVGKNESFKLIRLVGSNNLPILQSSGKPSAPINVAEKDMLSEDSTIAIGYTNVEWRVVVDVPREQVLATAKAIGTELTDRNDSNLRLSVLVGLLTVLSVLAALWVIAGAVARPIQTITRIATEVAHGDLDSARTLLMQSSHMKLKSAEAAQAKLDAQLHASNPDKITNSGALPKKETPDESEQLMDAMEDMINSLSSVVGQVKNSSTLLVTTATGVAAGVQQQQKTVTEFSASTVQIVAATKEISATSKELLETMNSVSEMASKTADLASTGRGKLDEMKSMMTDLGTSSVLVSNKLTDIRKRANEINRVVTTITKVADQTNLLSLNASIEAEKAGEYGRGFSVVALEIRRLADQTAVATLDIEAIVKKMHAAVEDGVKEMNKFSADVRHGVEEVSRIGDQQVKIIGYVQNLLPQFKFANESMHAQAQGAAQISDAMVQLSEGARRTGTTLQEFSRASDNLHVAVKNLSDEIARFKVTV